MIPSIAREYELKLYEIMTHAVVTIDFDELMTNVSEGAGSVQICIRIVEGMLAADKDVTLILQTVSVTASGNPNNDTAQILLTDQVFCYLQLRMTMNLLIICRLH